MVCSAYICGDIMSYEHISSWLLLNLKFYLVTNRYITIHWIKFKPINIKKVLWKLPMSTLSNSININILTKTIFDHIQVSRNIFSLDPSFFHSNTDKLPIVSVYFLQKTTNFIFVPYSGSQQLQIFPLFWKPDLILIRCPKKNCQM